MPNQIVIILGAGPAGLAAGYELSKRGKKVICIEKDSIVGGISKTVCRNGYRFDIGGHRFFTKINRVDALWREVLTDDFLRRPRLSRIYYNNRFFHYPLKPANALAGLGILASGAILASYLSARIHPSEEEKTFEQWVSNRFGKKLYRIFFKTYTEKVWGIPCDQIAAEWAAQRIKGLSLSSAVKAAVFGDKQKKIKTLIEEFDYPRYGPGQMYESMAERIRAYGGQVLLGQEVRKLHCVGSTILSVEVRDEKGEMERIEGSHFLSSLPISQLPRMGDSYLPETVERACGQLSYRSLLTVNLIMDRPESFPDTWIYIHSPEVKVGRIQCFKNWSPWMVPNENVSSLGMEYFCDENDELWNTADEDLISMAGEEIDKLELAEKKAITDAFVIRCPKTYPVYSIGYETNLQIIKEYLGGISNLQCIGRNGMFKYNNMDHSILSGLLAADNILGGQNDLWAINTEEEYHEQAKA